jgi:hypothetical protein
MKLVPEMDTTTNENPPTPSVAQSVPANTGG